MNQIQTHKLYRIWVLLEGLPSAGLGWEREREETQFLLSGRGGEMVPSSLVWGGVHAEWGVNELYKLGWGDRRGRR